MTAWLLPLAVGVGTGILSAWGVGGGTLLLLVMTLFLGVEQSTAQGINLLYFLPTAGAGLLFHRKSGLLDRQVLRQAVPWGVHHGRCCGRRCRGACWRRRPARGRPPPWTPRCCASPSACICWSWA